MFASRERARCTLSLPAEAFFFRERDRAYLGHRLSLSLSEGRAYERFFLPIPGDVREDGADDGDALGLVFPVDDRTQRTVTSHAEWDGSEPSQNVVCTGTHTLTTSTRERHALERASSHACPPAQEERHAQVRAVSNGGSEVEG